MIDEEKILEQQNTRLIKLGHELFNTGTGQMFIELLRKYLEHPVSPAQMSERYACIREGRNELIRELIRIQQMNKGEPKNAK